MIKLVEHLPPGTVRVEASGRVTDDDYREVLVAALQEALAREDVKLVYVLGKDFSYSAGAVWEDTKLSRCCQSERRGRARRT